MTAKLPDVIKKGLERLYSFQHADGGWGWWPHDQSTDRMSIYVLEGLARCRLAGVPVDDAVIDIESWLSGKISDIFAQKENTAFIAGNGVGQPRGITTYAAGTAWNQIEQVNSGSAGAVTADGLINVFYKLKDGYSKNANFMMNRTVVNAVRLLKEATTNQYLWQPGLAAGAPDTLMGVPVIMASDMPIAASGSLSVAVGDFKAGYQIVDRRGIRILRDPFT